MNIENEQIRQYFLGELPEDAAEELELRIITDPEFESIVVAVENALIEDHLDSSLTPREMRLFDENYLVTSERQNDVETIALLRRYAKTKLRPVSRQDSAAGKLGTFFQRVGKLFESVPSLVYAACLLLFVTGTVAYIFFLRDTSKSPLQAEYSSLNKQDFSDISRFKSLPLISAVPGSVRGTGSAVVLKGPETSALVRVALVDLKEESSVNAVLSRGETELLAFESLKTYGTADNRELRMLLPTRLLEKGTYQILVSGTGKPSLAATYVFSIE